MDALAIATEIARLPKSPFTLNEISLLEPVALYSFIEEYDYQWDGEVWSGSYQRDYPVATISVEDIHDGYFDVRVERPLSPRSNVSRTYQVKIGDQVKVYATTYSKTWIAKHWGGEEDE